MSTPVLEMIGWLMIHSLWEGMLIAVVTWMLCYLVLRRKSAATRYAILMIALAIMAATPLVTARYLNLSTSKGTVVFLDNEAGTLPLEIAVVPLQDVERPSSAMEASPAILQDPLYATSAPAEIPIDFKESTLQRLSQAIQPILKPLAISWGIGVIICMIKLGIGWCRIELLKRRSQPVTVPGLLAVLERTMEILSVRRTVQLLANDAIDSPIIVGLAKSVILVPTSFLNNTELSHVEAILAHELAHVRRYDYLFNLLQLLVETIYFYHPAVWWISHLIRLERENCCDDLAVTAVASPAIYGRALVALEEQRNRTIAPALGARDGVLVTRIRRLIDQSSHRDSIVPSGPLLVTSAIALSTLFALGVASLRADETMSDSNRSPTYVAQVSEDISVELLAIMPHNGSVDQAWRPDGTLFDSPPKLPPVPSNSATLQRDGVDLFLRFRGVTDGIRPTYEIDGLKEQWNADADGIASIIVVPPAETESSTLTVGIPDATWGPWRSINLQGETIEPVVLQPRVQQAYATIRPHRFQARNNQTLLQWAHDRDDSRLAHIEVIAVDTSGNKHERYGSTLWDDEEGVTRSADVFDLPIGKIEHIEFRLQPIRHWITFEHVSLTRAQVTEVSTRIESVPLPIDENKNASFQGRIETPDGSRLLTKGWMYYDAETTSGSYLGTVGDFENAFEFSSPAGEGHIAFFVDGYAPTWSTKIETAVGDRVEGITLRLQKGNEVRIEVRDDSDQPVPKASVVPLPEIYGATMGPIIPRQTDVQGIVILEDLADTRYVFRVESPGFDKLRTKPMTVQAGKTISLQLEPATTPADSSAPKSDVGVFSGTVLGPNGVPIPGASVYGVSSKTDGALGPVRAVTNEQGVFEFNAPDLTFLGYDGTQKRHETLVIAKADGLAADWMVVWGNETSTFREYWTPRQNEPIILTLGEMDVPIRGKLLAPDGQPLVGAKVDVAQVMIPANRDLTAHLDRWSKADVTAGFLTKAPSYLRELNQPSRLPNVQVSATTDELGEFELQGYGTDRIVQLRVSAPSVVTTWIEVMTRNAPDVGTFLDFDNRPTRTIYGADFSAQLKPGLSISGMLRDAESGLPLEDVWVSWNYDPVEHPDVAKYTPTTDQQGRFTIHGLDPVLLSLPPEKQHYLNAYPKPGQPYLKGRTKISAESLDIECVRGIPYHVRIIDDVGDDVDADVTYYTVKPNPLSGELVRSLSGVSRPVSNTALRSENGSYQGFVLPGPGAIMIKAKDSRKYRPALVEPRAFFAPDRNDWPKNNPWNSYGTTDLIVGYETWFDQNRFDAILLVDPPRNSEPLELTARLYAEHPREVRIVDEAGEPVSNVVSRMMWARSVTEETLSSSRFLLRDLHPLRPKQMWFYKESPELIGELTVVGEDTSPITVVMKKPSKLSGRILIDGKPAADVNVVSQHPLFYAKTNHEGRFEFPHVIPNHPYQIEIYVGPADQEGQRYKALHKVVVPESGIDHNLGDVEL